MWERFRVLVLDENENLEVKKNSQKKGLKTPIYVAYSLGYA